MNAAICLVELQSRGADPSIRTEDYDPYLNPGRHLPVDVCEDAEVKMKLKSLEDKYASTKRANIPHVDIGCWWTLYDYGLDQVKTWKPDYQHPYPGMHGKAYRNKCPSQ